jgi:outer membrane protein OmpA-like peptidoglycan-associated protein
MAVRCGMNGIACVAWSGALTLFIGGSVLAGEQPTENQILDALRPQNMSRSLTSSPVEAARPVEDQLAIDILHQGQKTHSLTHSQREQVAAVAKTKPKVDLEIYFDYDSAVIARRAVPDLNALGQALSNPDLRGSVFMIAGHTDAKGGERYNLDLSDRRAEAVRRYLVEKFNLSTEALNSIGYGKEQLKEPEHPFAAENRRVQVVNMGPKATAEVK